MLIANSCIVQKEYQYEETPFAKGAMKDLHECDRDGYVLAFYRDPATKEIEDRLYDITEKYSDRIFTGLDGDYWNKLFCWPVDIVRDEARGLTGLVVPRFPKEFFFEYGSKDDDQLGLKGKEKQSGWFTTDKTTSLLHEKERGSWGDMLSASTKLARAIRRLHASGLAHSDLSYKNVLVDPVERRVMLLDIDGLVVPEKHKPEVSGTPDFIDPLVVKTSHLPIDDPARITPSIKTDWHALAVLVYCYLFRRHPLRGGRQVHSEDPDLDESLSMGAKACWVEHPDNMPTTGCVSNSTPWGNLNTLPYTIAGPLLSALFTRAFTDGLQNANERPTADEWELALSHTCDQLRPCHNSKCVGEWYVQLPETKCCPFCQYESPSLPTLNFFTKRQESLIDEKRFIVAHSNGAHLFPWHTNTLTSPNEFYDIDEQPPVGKFIEQDSIIHFQNLSHEGFTVNGKSISIRESVELKNDDEWNFDEPSARTLKVAINE